MAVTDRRAFARIVGWAVPWLTAWLRRETKVKVVDISDGGILIESPTPMKPGQREIVVLQGNTTIKMAGWVERVQIIRLLPSKTYRAALRFVAPVSLSTLGSNQTASVAPDSCELMKQFEGWVQQLSGVCTACACPRLLRNTRTQKPFTSLCRYHGMEGDAGCKCFLPPGPCRQRNSLLNCRRWLSSHWTCQILISLRPTHLSRRVLSCKPQPRSTPHRLPWAPQCVPVVFDPVPAGLRLVITRISAGA